MCVEDDRNLLRTAVHSRASPQITRVAALLHRSVFVDTAKNAPYTFFEEMEFSNRVL